LPVRAGRPAKENYPKGGDFFLTGDGFGCNPNRQQA
jgi:hypothetical protein